MVLQHEIVSFLVWHLSRVEVRCDVVDWWDMMAFVFIMDAMSIWEISNMMLKIFNVRVSGVVSLLVMHGLLDVMIDEVITMVKSVLQFLLICSVGAHGFHIEWICGLEVSILSQLFLVEWSHVKSLMWIVWRSIPWEWIWMSHWIW